MPLTKCEELNYPTHFLNSWGSVIRKKMNTKPNKPHFLRGGMILMHCSLQIKQNMYLVGIFRAPVVTQFIVNV